MLQGGKGYWEKNRAWLEGSECGGMLQFQIDGKVQ